MSNLTRRDTFKEALSVVQDMWMDMGGWVGVDMGGCGWVGGCGWTMGGDPKGSTPYTPMCGRGKCEPERKPTFYRAGGHR